MIFERYSVLTMKNKKPILELKVIVRDKSKNLQTETLDLQYSTEYS